jgi:hypothetical protein
MPISGHGWELNVQRLGVHVSGSKKRTYGSYQVFQDGRALDGLSSHGPREGCADRRPAGHTR